TVPEPEAAVGMGQKAAGTRVLYHGRRTAGQIARSAVADPTGRQFDVGWLGATELTTRSLDVGAVLLRRRADIPGLTNLPAQGFQTGAPFLVVASEADCVLKGDRGVSRQLRVLQECGELISADLLAAQAD